MTYRDMGLQRRLERVVEMTGRRLGYLRKLSHEWRWVERCASWDATVLLARDEVVLTETEKLAREHMKALGIARALGTLSLAKDLRTARESNAKGSTVATRDALALLKEAVTLERLVIGEATSREVGRVELNLDGMAPERAELLLDLLSEAGVD